ncbi:phosphate ABC transporter substrate-binding protein [Sporosalibacterium faouarense]|uniref:phosphate ABC transporter substrate-binding protein n=1 Tax=Sporosalibacterium faouarense TaxID=516123 RepID=UPI00141C6C06|nr:phosphate ABC transporter substrate-binding protein [Sporosalibacterium faouarense]MTI49063.1 phosphate ABC transporter substrate-binding protein [Bacillota bacterium]
MSLFRKSRILVLALVVLLAFGALVGCSKGEETNNDVQDENNSQEENNNDNSNDSATGTVEIAGSTSVQPVAEAIAEAFMDKNSGVKVNIQGIGSSAGVKAAHNKTADIGTASRNLKTEEEGWGLTKHIIAYDGIAVVVHPSNGAIEDLTKEQVSKIFEGEITNWSEVGGNDAEIIVVSREAGSGTRGAFEEIMELEKEVDGKKVSAVTRDAIIAEGNGTVRQNVAQKENAIGYLSLAYLNDTVKPVEIDGTAPTVENILADKYPVSRPFLMLTNGDVTPEVQAYLDFVFSEEGQAKVAEEGAIPVK